MAYPRPIMPSRKTKNKVVQLKFDGGIDTVSATHDMDLSASPLCYNIICDKYSLKNGCGIANLVDKNGNPITFSQSLKGLWYIKCSHNNGQYIVHLADGKLYSLLDGEQQLVELSSTVYNTNFLAEKFCFDDCDALVLTDGNQLLVYKDNVLQQADAPSIKIMAVHYRRLFGASGDDDCLHFSAPTDACDWTQDDYKAGNVKLADGRGKIVALVSFKDYLYIFSEYGITKAEVYAKPSEFDFEQCYTSSGKIIGSTVKVCGDKVLFLTKQGLFSFDGNKTTQLLSKLNGLFSENTVDCQAEYFEGKYFLAFNANFDDGNKILCESAEFTNNALLIYEIADNKYSIMRGADIVSMFCDQANDKLLLRVNTSHGIVAGTLCNQVKLFDVQLPQYRLLPKTDFDNFEKKYLNYIEVGEVVGDINIMITADDNARTIKLHTQNKMQKIPVRLEGRSFTLSIYAHSPVFQLSAVNIVMTVNE